MGLFDEGLSPSHSVSVMRAEIEAVLLIGVHTAACTVPPAWQVRDAA